MLAAMLNQTITVQSITNVNVKGDLIPSYTDLFDTWATVTHKTVTTEDGVTVYLVNFFVRYDERITYKTRISYDGDYYKIIGKQPAGMFREALTIDTIRIENVKN